MTGLPIVIIGGSWESAWRVKP